MAILRKSTRTPGTVTVLRPEVPEEEIPFVIAWDLSEDASSLTPEVVSAIAAALCALTPTEDPMIGTHWVSAARIEALSRRVPSRSTR